MNTTHTKRDAERIATDRSLVHCVNVYLQSLALLELERRRVEPIHAELLRVWRPTCKRTGEAISDWRMLYLCGDDLSDLWKDMEAMYAEAGHWPDLKPGRSPDLVAEGVVRHAKQAIAERMTEWFPDCTLDRLLCAGLDTYERYIELIVRMVVNHPSYRKPEVAA